jgi:hypothetical protein
VITKWLTVPLLFIPHITHIISFQLTLILLSMPMASITSPLTSTAASNASHHISFRSYAKSKTNSVAERLALLKLARDKLVDALATDSGSLKEKSKTDSS